MWQNLINQLLLHNLEGSYQEVRTKKFLNYVCLVSVILSSIFLIINLTIGYYQLSTVIFLNLLVSLLCIIYNKKGLTDNIITFLSVFFSTLTAYSAINFRNGLENYIIINMACVILIQRKTNHVIFISLFNIVLYLFAEYKIATEINIQSLPLYRKMVNYAICIVIVALAAQYFKKIYAEYINKIEEQKNKIVEQQNLLEISKQELTINNERLQNINTTQEQLLSIVAHDIRSPLAALKTSLELYHNNTINTTDFTNITKELSLQVDTLQNNLENLLQWTHNQMGGLITKKTFFSINAVLIDCIGLLQKNLDNKQIKVETNLLANATVFADADQLKIVIRNLISNAIKFSYTNSKIYISTTIKDNFLMLTIKDEGIGMTQDTIQKIFSIAQIKSTYVTNNEKGVGLGLLLCKQFIDNNNGSIEIRSAEKKGTTIYLEIPLKDM